MPQAPLAKASDVVKATAEMLRPPRRLKPAEAAEKYVRTNQGPWLPDLTPELIEPLNMLGERRYTGIVFVGPARTGKTLGLILAGVGYIVTCSPGDTLIVQMTNDSARDFSRTDLDRTIRHSPEIAARMSSRARDDNTFDKVFKSGMIVKLGWPAVSQLSSKTLKYVFLTDYDRPENRDDVDGEGPLWDLAAKRIETFMSRGKCLAESSPAAELLDARWKPQSPHEAPPAGGILSLYNRGTRARLFWPCLHCGFWFQAEPGIGPFNLPAFEELESIVLTQDIADLAAQWAVVACPSCGGIHKMTDRMDMKQKARWVHEGETIEGDGIITGERRNTAIVSYWLGGVAATYQRWDSIISKYLQAIASYKRTGDEAPIKFTVNTDQAAAYLPRSIATKRSPDSLLGRVEEWPRGVVPQGVRFLTAAVDVQANKFVVAVIGWGQGLESWLIDRYDITGSERISGDVREVIDPSAYQEDWDTIIDKVVLRTFPVEDSDIRMPITVTLCDSGGKKGVTQRAYEFWRRLRDRALHKRLQLVKGTGNMNAPRAVVAYPDSRGKDNGIARGDVPVWMLNVNLLKDGVAADLNREQPGPGYHHIPQWVDGTFFEELTAETRTDKGWIKTSPSARNEQFDLHVYNRAACVIADAEKIDWNHPPEWAKAVSQRLPTNVTPVANVRSRRVRSPGVR